MNKEHKYYVIYQITNNVNGKIYIGKHETDNLDDDYFGSGKHLINAQKKYGLENFTKSILFYCQNEEEMNLLEHCVVTPEFCKREDVYNLNEGGDGGWSYVNSIVNTNPNLRQQINKKISQKSNGEYRHSKEYSEAISTGLKRAYKENPNKHGTLGKHWKSSKMSSFMKNPQNNTMTKSVWIYNISTLESKIFPKNLPIPNGWLRGRKPPKKIDETRASHQYCWINNSIQNKYVKKVDVLQYLQNGWVKGRLVNV